MFKRSDLPKYHLFLLPVLLSVLWLTLPTVQAQNDSNWSSGMDMPTARKDMANSAVTLDDKIYVIGGVSSDGFFRTRWRFTLPLQIHGKL
jgi:hypothetical protein